jgi:hypothetical protein
MTFSNFLKEIDPVVHKQYVFERFKEGTTGRGTVVEEPAFKFEKPEFKSTIDLPLASTVDVSRTYLEKRKLDPTKSLQKDHSTQRFYSIALLCAVQTVMLGSGVLALLFGFMITSQGLRKLRQESPTPSLEVTPLSSGPQISMKKI